jgi:hypothetical protein
LNPPPLPPVDRAAAEMGGQLIAWLLHHSQPPSWLDDVSQWRRR